MNFVPEGVLALPYELQLLVNRKVFEATRNEIEKKLKMPYFHDKDLARLNTNRFNLFFGDDLPRTRYGCVSLPYKNNTYRTIFVEVTRSFVTISEGGFDTVYRRGAYNGRSDITMVEIDRSTYIQVVSQYTQEELYSGLTNV